MFWALAIRVCRALLLKTLALYGLIVGRPRAWILDHSFQWRDFQRAREFQRMSSPRNRLKEGNRDSLSSGTLWISENLYSYKASYVGTRIVVNKVNFVIVLRKDTD